MRVLIGCEESQTECMAFRALRHEAYSCDIQEPSGGHPEWHILGDALEAMRGGQITTMDGQTHDIPRWDLMIAHPPCTYLSNAGAVNLRKHGILNMDRMAKAVDAKKFFMACLEAPIPHICVENPIPGRIHKLPPYSQIIQPYMFGDEWMKTTCLWLINLPILMATDIVVPTGKWVDAGHTGRPAGDWSKKGHRNAKMRSKSFPGIARAMAEQWGGLT